MNCRGNLPEHAPRGRSISASKNSPQGIARNIDLRCDSSLAEVFDKRFQFGGVRARCVRVRAVRNVCAFVEAQTILFFPAVRLLADVRRGLSEYADALLVRDHRNRHFSNFDSGRTW